MIAACRGGWILLLGTCLVAGGRHCAAQSVADSSEPPAANSSFLTDLLFDSGQETPRAPATPVPDVPKSVTSKFLTGDMFGWRSAFASRGLSLYTSMTQFEQGVASGGIGRGAVWGSKFDMLAHVDTSKAGVWDGATFDLFAESRLGNSIDNLSGFYSPANLAMYFPVPDQQVTAITGLKFTQQINDHLGVYAGKLNALNGEPGRFLKYPLTSRFWNAAFNFNLALDRYPYSALGAGGYWYSDSGRAVSFVVLDSHNAPRTSGFEHLGQNGVFLYSELKQPTQFFGLPGKQTLATLFGTGSFTDLEPASFIDLPPVIQTLPKKSGTYTLLWNMEQRLWEDASGERGIDLYIQNGLGDGNPNPVRWFFAAELCGNVPLAVRENDTWGVGVYHLTPSGTAKDLVTGLRNEQGVELFYNMRLGRGCHLTPDVQVVNPGLVPVDTAIVLGLRLKLDF